MDGPLAQQFAQVREALLLALPEHGGVCDGTDAKPSAKDPRGSFANPCIRCRVLLAFDSPQAVIERHVQDMESAIEEWAFDQGYDSLSSESIVVDIRNRAAALPAREKDCPGPNHYGDHSAGCGGFGDKCLPAREKGTE